MNLRNPGLVWRARGRGARGNALRVPASNSRSVRGAGPGRPLARRRRAGQRRRRVSNRRGRRGGEGATEGRGRGGGERRLMLLVDAEGPAGGGTEETPDSEAGVLSEESCDPRVGAQAGPGSTPGGMRPPAARGEYGRGTAGGPAQFMRPRVPMPALSAGRHGR